THNHLHGSSGEPKPVVAGLAAHIVIDDRPPILTPTVIVRPDESSLTLLLAIAFAEAHGFQASSLKLRLIHLAIEDKLLQGKPLGIAIVVADALRCSAVFKLICVNLPGVACDGEFIRLEIFPDGGHVGRPEMAVVFVQEACATLIRDFLPLAQARILADSWFLPSMLVTSVSAVGI